MKSAGGVATLEVGVFTTASVLTIAQESGLLERAGVRVNVQEVAGSGQQLAGLRDGTFDLIQTSPDNIMRARMADALEASVIFALDTGLPQVLAGAPGITSVAELRGATVGVDGLDSGFAFVVFDLLSAAGVDRSEVEFVSVGSSRQRLDALASGEISGGLLSASMALGAADRGLSVLARASELMPWYPGVAVAALDARARECRPAVVAFCGALHAALDLVNNPDTRGEAVEALALGSGITTERAEAVLSREGAARTAGPLSSRAAAEALAKVADLRHRYTGIAPIDYFDSELMDQILGA
jgi:ABC-type nitrate/sulfonate/bicarbonate transport system substrate-binding protein